MIPMIYFFTLVAWLALMFGFWKRDFPIVIIIGFFMMCISVYVFASGLEGTKEN